MMALKMKDIEQMAAKSRQILAALKHKESQDLRSQIEALAKSNTRERMQLTQKMYEAQADAVMLRGFQGSGVNLHEENARLRNRCAALERELEVMRHELASTKQSLIRSVM